MKNNKQLYPVSTVLSIDSRFQIPEITQAKEYLVKQCNSRYGFPTSHLSYSIIPLKEDVFLKARDYILDTIKNIKPYTIKIGDVQIEENRSFIYLPVTSNQLFNLHKFFTEALDKFHTNEVREKDIIRLEEGKLSDLEQKYLYQHGYYRILDNFRAHLTIGSLEKEDCNKEEVLTQLQKLLQNIVNTDFTIDSIHIVFHTDAVDQKDMKVIWEETVRLA